MEAHAFNKLTCRGVLDLQVMEPSLKIFLKQREALQFIVWGNKDLWETIANLS